VRLTPALFGLGGVLLTYAVARRLYGRGAGMVAGIVLGTSVFYAGVARFLVLDMAVSVLMASTLFCFILGMRERPGWRRRAFFWGMYASAALATLTKGLIGFMLTGLVMLLWLLVGGQWKRLRPLYLPSGLTVFLLIAAPWHVAVAVHNPTWAHFYFVHEHWERFTTKQHGRYQPPYFFVPILIGGLFPWVGHLWPALRRGGTDAWRRRGDHPERIFFLIWAATIFAFFSASGSKLPPYILPVFPAVAVVLGEWLAGVWRDNDARALRFGTGVFAAMAVVLAAAAGGAVLFPGKLHLDADTAAALRRYAVALAAILFGGAVAALRTLRRGDGRASLVAAGLTAVLMVGVVSLATPLLYKPGTRPLAAAARGRGVARIYSYHEYFPDFTYYAGRTVELVAFQGELEPENDPLAVQAGRFVTEAQFRSRWNQSEPALVVARKRDLAPLMANPDFHYQLIAQTRDHYLLGNR
jgi:4-amino-4-deoxy-L-arabinose transferase-like glycosyltransferase